MLGDTLCNLVALVTWRPEFVHSWLLVFNDGGTYRSVTVCVPFRHLTRTRKSICVRTDCDHILVERQFVCLVVVVVLFSTAAAATAGAPVTLII
jgi:hypothetical protein